MSLLAAGIEQADDMEQGDNREAGITEWQSDVEGLVAVYDTLVSVPDHNSLIYATEGLQVMPSLLRVVWQVCDAGLLLTSMPELLAANCSQPGLVEQTGWALNAPARNGVLVLVCNALFC